MNLLQQKMEEKNLNIRSFANFCGVPERVCQKHISGTQGISTRYLLHYADNLDIDLRELIKQMGSSQKVGRKMD